MLAFEIGLILESNQSESNRQLGSSVNQLESPRHHLYLSMYEDFRPSRVFMDFYSYSQDVINELRAGNRRMREAVWFFITI